MGLATVRALAAEGFHLALVARSAPELERLAQELKEAYPSQTFWVLPADLSNKAQIAELGQKLQRWPQLDVIVHNAGIFRPATVMDQAEGDLEYQMELNAFSAFYLTRALFSLLRPGSHLFTICSIASKQGMAGSAAYSMSKAALLSFTQALRLEWQELGIRVTAVLPGQTYTSSWEGSSVLPERLLAPEAIAEAIVACWKLPPGAVVEEILLRPQLGDL